MSRKYIQANMNHEAGRDKHKRLVDLTSRVLQVLNQEEITYWLTDGSLLGWYRHEDVIPWDDDTDIAILDADGKSFDRSMNAIKKANIGNMSTNFYDDNTHAALLVQSEEDADNNWDIGVDFVRYTDTDINNTELFPLQTVVYCGNLCYVPNKAYKILTETYNNLNIPYNENPDNHTSYAPYDVETNISKQAKQAKRIAFDYPELSVWWFITHGMYPDEKQLEWINKASYTDIIDLGYRVSVGITYKKLATNN